MSVSRRTHVPTYNDTKKTTSWLCIFLLNVQVISHVDARAWERLHGASSSFLSFVAIYVTHAVCVSLQPRLCLYGASAVNLYAEP